MKHKTKHKTLAEVGQWVRAFLRHPSRWAWKNLARNVCGLVL